MFKVAKSYRDYVIDELAVLYGSEDAVNEKYNELEDRLINKEGYMIAPLAVYGYMLLTKVNVPSYTCEDFLMLCCDEPEGIVMSILDLFMTKLAKEVL